MPMIAADRMTDSAFESWYTKNRKGNALKNFMELSKEDKGKARERLKKDVTMDALDVKQKEMKKLYKDAYLIFSHDKKTLTGTKLARFIRDHITEKALDLWDDVEAVRGFYGAEKDPRQIDELRSFIKQVNKKYPDTFQCDYDARGAGFYDTNAIKRIFPLSTLKNAVRDYNYMAQESDEYEELDGIDDAEWMTNRLTIDGTEKQRTHDKSLWDMLGLHYA